MSKVLSLPRTDEDRLIVLRAMVDEFEAYLESYALHRQLVIQTPETTYMPNMSVGSVLAVRQSLERSMTHLLPAQRVEYETIIEKLRRVRTRHLDAFMEKLRRELKSLLDSWTWYIDGCEEGDEDCEETYASEVWIRTRIEDLMDEARGRGMRVDDEEDRLMALDRRLDAMFASGAYIGRKRQQSDRPAERYWWLYGGVTTKG